MPVFYYLQTEFFISVCDPVMGDEGKLYVPPELVSVYRDKVSSQLLLKADIGSAYSFINLL